MASGSLALAATASAGTPLAMNPMPGPGAEREIDGIGDHRLLQLGVAAEGGRFHRQPVLGPDPLCGADLERREGKCGGGGLADADGVGGTGIGQASRRKANTRPNRQRRRDAPPFVPRAVVMASPVVMVLLIFRSPEEESTRLPAQLRDRRGQHFAAAHDVGVGGVLADVSWLRPPNAGNEHHRRGMKRPSTMAS